MTAYLFDNKSYPIFMTERNIAPALCEPFTRAVTLRDPALKLDTRSIRAVLDKELAAKYWMASEERAASGRVFYTRDITADDVLEQSRAAGITMDAPVLHAFAGNCNKLRAMFSRIFYDHTGLDGIEMRGFLLFTPVRGRGRSPELHVDNTRLSLHWSAALATFSVANGEPDEATWNALDRHKQDAMSPKERKKNFEFLVRQAGNPDLDIRDNLIGDVIITKGQRSASLLCPEIRKAVCVHTSSDSITMNGQAAFLLTPKMP